MIVIALTGGSCAGKSTGIVKIRERLCDLGFSVAVVPELATLIFNSAGRIDPKDRIQNFRHERAMLKGQIALEDAIKCTLPPGPKSVLLTDRGAMDMKAFLTDEEWNALLSDEGWTEFELFHKRYDGVIHLVTAAQGAPFAYKREGVRIETPEEAILQDQKLQKIYLGHAHHKIIDNSTDFETKMTRTVEAICNILGVPEPLEQERRYLLVPKTLDSAKHVVIPEGVTSIIEQTYLQVNEPGVSRRIRARKQNGGIMYTQTEKKYVRPGVRIEKERIISGSEYLRLLAEEKDEAYNTLTKRRTCFLYENRCYELDVFLPPAKPYVILEVEVEDINQTINIPTFLSDHYYVTEVTNNPSLYGNYSLAKK